MYMRLLCEPDIYLDHKAFENAILALRKMIERSQERHVTLQIDGVIPLEALTVSKLSEALLVRLARIGSPAAADSWALVMGIAQGEAGAFKRAVRLYKLMIKSGMKLFMWYHLVNC
jgi:hypothetical protein